MYIAQWILPISPAPPPPAPPFMISSFHRYKYPFSEKLIFEMADRMAEDGFKDAGYEFVSIDVSTYHVTCYKA